MKTKSVEKIGKNADFTFGMIRYNAGVRKWLKRQSNKLMRRLAKLGDDAPKRVPIRGWND